MLRDGHCFRDLSIGACARARITPNIVFESGQFSSLLGMVAAGAGVSIVPEMAISRHVGCRYVRLSDTNATRTIVAAIRRGRSFSRVQRSFVSGFGQELLRFSSVSVRFQKRVTSHSPR